MKRKKACLKRAGSGHASGEKRRKRSTLRFKRSGEGGNLQHAGADVSEKGTKRGNIAQDGELVHKAKKLNVHH